MLNSVNSESFLSKRKWCFMHCSDYKYHCIANWGCKSIVLSKWNSYLEQIKNECCIETNSSLSSAYYLLNDYLMRSHSKSWYFGWTDFRFPHTLKFMLLKLLLVFYCCSICNCLSQIRWLMRKPDCSMKLVLWWTCTICTSHFSLNDVHLYIFYRTIHRQTFCKQFIYLHQLGLGNNNSNLYIMLVL